VRDRPPPPARGRAAADAGKHRGRTRQRWTRRDAAPPPPGGVGPGAARAAAITFPRRDLKRGYRPGRSPSGVGAWRAMAEPPAVPASGSARLGAGAVERGGLEMRFASFGRVPLHTAQSVFVRHPGCFGARRSRSILACAKSSSAKLGAMPTTGRYAMSVPHNQGPKIAFSRASWSPARKKC
jgi:hypothetical protein